MNSEDGWCRLAVAEGEIYKSVEIGWGEWDGGGLLISFKVQEWWEVEMVLFLRM